MIDKTLAYQPDELLADNAGLLYERAGSATYAAYGRLEWHPDERFEDARQAAAAAYWEAHQRNPLDTYAWTAGKYDAINELRHKSVYTLSLDAPDTDDNDPWIDNIAAPEEDQVLDDHWLDDHDLPRLVSHLMKRPSQSAIRYQSAILRLLASGYDTAAIAITLDRTQEAIKSTRHNLRKRLFNYCDQLGIDTSHIQVKNGGWRPAHHYAEMDNTAANHARWGSTAAGGDLQTAPTERTRP